MFVQLIFSLIRIGKHFALYDAGMGAIHVNIRHKFPEEWFCRSEWRLQLSPSWQGLTPRISESFKNTLGRWRNT